jgi:hypothetical protein
VSDMLRPREFRGSGGQIVVRQHSRTQRRSGIKWLLLRQEDCCCLWSEGVADGIEDAAVLQRTIASVAATVP